MANKSYRDVLLTLKDFLDTNEFKEEAIRKLSISEPHLVAIIKSISSTIDTFASGKPLKGDPINDYLKTNLEQGDDEEFWSILQSRKVSTEEMKELKNNMLKLISVLKEMK